MDRVVERVTFEKKFESRFKRVAAYCRVSSAKDAALHSLATQIYNYSTEIQNNPEWIYVGVYADEGISGTKDDRAEFLRLIDDCNHGKIDMIITKSLSRFARNTETLLRIVRQLKKIGVDVYFEEQRIHTISSEGELMLSLLASFAQAQSQSVSDNMKWIIRNGFQNGELMNLRFLYGYTIVKNEVSINAAEAEIVKEIFSRVISGEALSSISRDLNNRGIKRNFGGEWKNNHIRTLVSNEKYMGNALLQKTFKNNYVEKRKVRNKGELPMYYAEGTHPAIIDENTFKMAQDALSKIKCPQKTPMVEHSFTGLIYCPFCGKNYKRIRSTHTGAYGWNCSTYISKGKNVCHGKAIPDEVLKQVTTDVLGLETFSKSALRERVKRITVPEDNCLIFEMINGEEVKREWKSSRKSPGKDK